MAWAAPVVSVGAAAPAVAASPAPGLQGWIQWSRSCNNSTVTLTVDGSGGTAGSVYPSGKFGFYVFSPPGGNCSSLTNACVTWGYSPNFTNSPITWTTLSGSGSGWSLPTYNSATGLYKTCYSGTWTYNSPGGTDGPYCITDQVPIFQGTVQATSTDRCGTTRTINITRCVQINGNPVCFDRSITV